jgi:glutamate synthase domain-containing protein 2
VAIAAGADWCASARGFMLSVGCIQALHCNTNFCPAGVATHNKWLQRGLVPDIKAPQVTNYHAAVLHDFADVLASCGYDTATELSRKDLMKVVSWHDIRPLSELMPYPWDHAAK